MVPVWHGRIGSYGNAQYSLGHIGTDEMAAAIFTKFFPMKKKMVWDSVSVLIGIYSGPDWSRSLGQPGAGRTAAVDRMKVGAFKGSAACVALPPDPYNHPYLDAFNPPTWYKPVRALCRSERRAQGPLSRARCDQRIGKLRLKTVEEHDDRTNVRCTLCPYRVQHTSSI